MVTFTKKARVKLFGATCTIFGFMWGVWMYMIDSPLYLAGVAVGIVGIGALLVPNSMLEEKKTCDQHGNID